MFSIREEQDADIEAIRRVNDLAFGREVEGGIVDAVRRDGAVTLSLVAVEGQEIVGHVLFSPVVIDSESASFEGVALGPIAVHPARQRQGIGTALVRGGLARLAEMGHAIVVVLGHPEYYPRFGFEPARQFGLSSQWDVPDEVFMAQALRMGAFQRVAGVVRYHGAFSD